jgi:hypothetical protein
MTSPTILNSVHSLRQEERTLAHVLLDLRQADADWRDWWGADEESAHLDRMDALQAEARTMIERATGVSWAQIEGADL